MIIRGMCPLLLPRWFWFLGGKKVEGTQGSHVI